MKFNEAWNKKVLDIDVARSLNKLQINLQHFKNDEHEKDTE